MVIDWGVIARVVHVLAVVVWIGGVWFVTTVLLPAVKQKPSEEWMGEFHAIEHRFGPHARIAVLLVLLSGLYMLYAYNLWDWFTDSHYWWMHLMVGVWLLFAALLFVIEPLIIRRTVQKRETRERGVSGNAHPYAMDSPRDACTLACCHFCGGRRRGRPFLRRRLQTGLRRSRSRALASGSSPNIRPRRPCANWRTHLDYATARSYRQGENPVRWRGHLENLLPKKTEVRTTLNGPVRTHKGGQGTSCSAFGCCARDPPGIQAGAVPAQARIEQFGERRSDRTCEPGDERDAGDWGARSAAKVSD